MIRAGADTDEDVIDVEGVMKLIEDMGIEPTDKALVCFTLPTISVLLI